MTDNIMYHCLCGWHGDILPTAELRCPRCGDVTLGWTTMDTDPPDPRRAPAPFVFSGWQRRQGVARIVESIFECPVQAKRWRAKRRRFYGAVRERCHPAETPRHLTIRTIAQTAFSLILPRLPPMTLEGTDLAPASLERWARTLRRLMNDEVTQDLLGADWRTSDRRHTPPATNNAEHEAFLRILDLLNDPQNTIAEREAMQAFLESDGDIQLTAERLHRTPDAVKQTFYRLRKRHASCR